MMKKLLCLILLISAGLLIQCKKNSDLVVNPGTKPDPETQVPQLVKAAEFLKMLSVTGSEKIVFDSTTKNYFVSLPDSYDESKAEVKLSLQKNIFLWDSTASTIIKDSIIRYNYKGTAPLLFKLSDNPEKSWFFFTVYFNFSGTPKIELLSKEIPLDIRGSDLPLRILAKVGSIPASPGQYGPMVNVTNRKTGYTAESSLYPENNYVNFYEAEKLLTNDPITLEIIFYNQKPVVFEGIKFTRSIPKLYLAPEYKSIYTPKDTIKVNGGFFIPAAKYSVTFTSDYIPAPVSIDIKFEDPSRLTANQIPSTLPEGSYVVSFYEDDRLLGKNAIFVSATDKNCIESIWKGDVNSAQNRNVSSLSYNKGDTFFAKTVPLSYGPGNSTADYFNAVKLPDIRLKNGQKSVDLKPELVVFNWSVATISYAVGKYKIPADFPSGTYEVTALQEGRKETKPYWSKMQVH